MKAEAPSGVVQVQGRQIPSIFEVILEGERSHGQTIKKLWVTRKILSCGCDRPKTNRIANLFGDLIEHLREDAEVVGGIQAHRNRCATAVLSPLVPQGRGPPDIRKGERRQDKARIFWVIGLV